MARVNDLKIPASLELPGNACGCNDCSDRRAKGTVHDTIDVLVTLTVDDLRTIQQAMDMTNQNYSVGQYLVEGALARAHERFAMNEKGTKSTRVLVSPDAAIDTGVSDTPTTFRTAGLDRTQETTRRFEYNDFDYNVT